LREWSKSFNVNLKGKSKMLYLPFGAGLALMAIIAFLLYVPSPFQTKLRDTFTIRKARFKKAITTPIERELEMIAGPQKVINESHSMVQDLRGTLVHEYNVLLQRQDDLAAAEAQYDKAADDKNDTGIDELLLLVAEKEKEVTLQQGVVDGHKAAVDAACGAVDKARKELRHIQMTIKSDEAIAKATAALDAAAQVMEAARTMTADGGALKEASGEISRDFATARARVDGLQDRPGERELNKMGEQQQLADLRKRLDSKRESLRNSQRPATATPTQSQS
jgi:hypothetical protein